MQIFGLPKNQVTPLNTQNIGDSIFKGIVPSEELMLNDEDWDPIMRIKVKLDLTKSLPKGFYNRRPGKEEWVHFRYERLPAFYS